MDLNKIKKLFENVKLTLHEASIGELLFMHHVTLESIEIISELPDEEIYKTAVALEQCIYNEIARRLEAKELLLTDPADFYLQLKQYYIEVGDNNKFLDDIQSSLLDKKRKSKKDAKAFRERLDKRSNDFFKSYQKSFNIDCDSPSPVPSPSSIINSPTKPNIPNN